ncbi:hypothetical protein P43SY_000090 [Pythium insidiosum]|uniref:HTH CENPB-type domain-containing protein n=1 Tax=Pythium insidiosum TaxID=114742 RepID=A0AAD5Q5R2_PYTIN|nr:hypothetical protein P43SY_000090 [Pythium insidiosum]
MPSRRLSKSMAEKLEVIEWIEKEGGGVPTRATSYFQNTKGWQVSSAQIRYWWKKRDEIKASSPTQLRLKGGGAKPQLDVIEDMIFDMIIARRSDKQKVSPFE